MTKIAQMVGIENLKVTTYVGRHTYATTLKNAGISIAVISEALGHESENVTQIYLKQFDHEEFPLFILKTREYATPSNHQPQPIHN